MIDSYTLGILWAYGRDDGDRFILRCKHLEILHHLQLILGTDYVITQRRSRTNIQYVLRIRGDIRHKMLNILAAQGWAPRNADIREYPSDISDHFGFIRAWIQYHSSIDISSLGSQRVRIYGNKVLLEVMNDIISKLTGLPLLTPQRVTSKTYALYYQGQSAIRFLSHFKINKEEVQND